ncbi:hypothetical protein TRAPUB_10605 [Trametes pubescens]|uniref:Uncharacterized protein n=1 Tax=Trametes pubescens TaxID=154538 RepID=A0A1M2VZ13_TRAPU|nr:hypothetical protein TRAPUB_10605 [Trametes pubescens]
MKSHVPFNVYESKFRACTIMSNNMAYRASGMSRFAAFIDLIGSLPVDEVSSAGVSAAAFWFLSA